MVVGKSGKRTLMAIVFLELTGYTRIMSRSEALALSIFQELEALVREEISVFRGQLVKFGADGFFCVFPTGVSAASFALKVQAHIAARNAKAGQTDRFQTRMGIHLGDVMRERGQLVGDAVNIAAHITPMADPGGIAMTDTVHSQVKNRITVSGTFVSAPHHDFPEHMQVFLLPPKGKILLLWSLRKHLGRTLAVLFVGAFVFLITYYLMNRDHSERMALGEVESLADPDSLQMAAQIQQEADQELSSIPRIRWVSREGVEYLMSRVPGDPPNPQVRALEAARQGGVNYLMTCRVEKTPENRWKLKYRIISTRTLVVVDAASLEGTDADSLVQELERQVGLWAAKPASE